jgi:hypothetical protein
MKRKTYGRAFDVARTADTARARTASRLPEPDCLVGLGFRYWVLGRKTGRIEHWERAWSLYTGLFGLCGARMAVGSLSCWVASLARASLREIEVLSGDGRHFCRDECLAVSMIAACQHNTCPAMRACAFALIESSMIDCVIDEAHAFADILISLEQRLSPGSIVAAPIRPAGSVPH